MRLEAAHLPPGLLTGCCSASPVRHPPELSHISSTPSATLRPLALRPPPQPAGITISQAPDASPADEGLGSYQQLPESAQRASSAAGALSPSLHSTAELPADVQLAQQDTTSQRSQRGSAQPAAQPSQFTTPPSPSLIPSTDPRSPISEDDAAPAEPHMQPPNPPPEDTFPAQDPPPPPNPGVCRTSRRCDPGVPEAPLRLPVLCPSLYGVCTAPADLHAAGGVCTAPGRPAGLPVPSRQRCFKVHTML